eukprot:TRINITY_DN75167_c0_g1_i1.p1 TRINITY_DN75167_c0_g1~~TRINITY_DN75167_c0_g1_i1.p1  ORF type:complete len:247 (-),score=74.08 TRINITY_DN75167_c0_g1_i1:185-859(-)
MSAAEASYARAKGRGALSFKGEDDRKKKKRRAEKTVPGQPKPEEGEAAAASSMVERDEVPLNPGSGRIVSSGFTLHGFETKFKEEVEVGDSIMVHHPVSLQVEIRVVTGVLSQRSMTIHQAFSKDVVSTLEFHVRKDSLTLKQQAKNLLSDKGETADEDIQDAASKELQRQLDKKLKKQAKTVTIREKTGMWGYKTVTKKLDKAASREEMLDERCRQGRDKYCF